MTHSPETLEHTIEPIIFPSAKVLILGTFPSPKSREAKFFYGHPRNRFWPVMAAVLGEPTPETIHQKKELLVSHNIAIWDVLASCTITGASDSSIKDPVPNDIAAAIKGTDIKAIFTTGQKATQLYKKYCQKKTGIEPIALPSPSPANCAMSFDQLVKRYSLILRYLGLEEK